MNKNHLKKLISAAVLGMVVLTGCGVNDAAPQEETAEPLRVGMLRVDDSFPFYVAEKEGLFEKHQCQCGIERIQQRPRPIHCLAGR